MQGGRIWGETRSAARWIWGTVLVLGVATLGLSSLALMRSFEADAPVARGDANGSQIRSSSVPDVVETPPAHASEDRPSRSSREIASVPTSGVIEAAGALPEAALVESEVLADLVPPVRLVGRGATDRSLANVEPEPDELPADLPKLTLQGTSVIDGQPVAVVNYPRVFEGDLVEGARVVKILDRAVELEFKGERFTIRL